jgi:hypothetical protein
MFISPAQTANSPLIISEFRLRGPGGPADVFIEIYREQVQVLRGDRNVAVQ